MVKQPCKNKYAFLFDIYRLMMLCIYLLARIVYNFLNLLYNHK